MFVAVLAVFACSVLVLWRFTFSASGASRDCAERERRELYDRVVTHPAPHDAPTLPQIEPSTVRARRREAA